MEATVRTFNNLPRPSTMQEVYSRMQQVPNHWVFGARHVPPEVPANPPGDLVVVVNPQLPSDALVHAGPTQILSLPTTSAKAEAIIPVLLRTFIEGYEGQFGRLSSDAIIEPFAPRTWSTDDSELAAAIAEGLKQHGVTNELQNLSICSTEERDTLDLVWSRTLVGFQTMQGVLARDAANPGDRSRCHGCGIEQRNLSQTLMKCSACHKAFYHSKACQRRHWEHHRQICHGSLVNQSSSDQPLTSSSAPSHAGLDAYTYYHTVARKSSDAQALLQTLKLDPARSGGVSTIAMRVLVVTGQDSPENLELLFGPNWHKDGKHEETRLDVLLNAPPGSPSYKLDHTHFHDNLKVLDRSPRPATDTEQRKIAQVREMQEAIRQRVGAGRQPSKQDMIAILTGFGSNGLEKTQIYTLAVNTMDQGAEL